jgi:hypothetical protein
MPFKYIIKWHHTQPEKVSVEAYHRYPQTQEEKHKPAFIIGRAAGSGLLAIRHALEKARETNPTTKRGKTIYISLNESDQTAYENAYRIGLATALISKAQTQVEIEKGTRYVLNAMPEEIWFWTSKLLDDEINTRALDALAVLSGATELNNSVRADTTHPIKQARSKIGVSKKGIFWPIVRRRMKEKAMQLYMKDHPEIQAKPELNELRKTSYMQAAKTIVLKEMQAEKRKAPK